MFSLIMINTAKPLSLSTPFLPSLLNSPHKSKLRPPNSKPNSIVALIIPPKSSSSEQQKQNFYQPFRPPPSPLSPQYRSLDTNGRLEVLSNRLGLWFEYAPLISSLFQEGFTPSTLEEITGVPGVEQNMLVVAAQVRDSLVQSQIDPDVLSFFDTSGASALLYEIRLLNAAQRAAAAKYLVLNKFDAKMTQDLARSMKDKPRRRGEKGWDSFDDDLPGDCLAFMYFRQAQEHTTASSPQLRRSALERALEAVESDTGRKRVLEELEEKEDGEKDKEGAVEDAGVKVPVVRMQIGEIAEATVVRVLPVCRAEEREVKVEEAPWECGGGGDFGVVEAEKGWSRWVVLPGWEPVAGLKRGGVAVAFKNARVLPWRANKWNKEESIMVVADRGRKEVEADDGFYLVVGGGNGRGEEGLKMERGLALKEIGVTESLGTVVLVIRPPREEYDNQLSDEDWE